MVPKNSSDWSITSAERERKREAETDHFQARTLSDHRGGRSQVKGLG